MATPTPKAVSSGLTYEEYLAEGLIPYRYDIVDGVRILMPAPSWRHQRIQMNAMEVLRGYEKRSGRGYVIAAPFDLLIRRLPTLQTRQPDLLFVSREQIERGGGIPESGPLEVAPELVVEILSESETERILADKLADYAAIGVQEGWLIRPRPRTVTVVRLSPGGPVVAADYGEIETLQSLTFPDLSVPVAEFFRP